MFPFHNSDELFFGNPSDPNRHDEILEDPTSGYLVFDQTKGKHTLDVIEKKDESSEHMRKEKGRIPHKEIERQRRKEMSDLLVSLRSLLPIELIKGKRSKSDHMHGAINYIKQLEKNTEELKIKRDELNKLSNCSRDTPTEASNSLSPCVTVNSCEGGLEVLANCSCGENGVPLSEVLRVLNEEGLNVVSLVSTQVNERLLHTIICEVTTVMFDMSLLQQKLVRLYLSSS